MVGAKKVVKTPFAPLPIRAIGDQRFAATHFRVLGVIAQHDRLSLVKGKGQGCWASHRTLAVKCGINYNNLSTAISELATWGYIVKASHPLNRRQHVYRVIYETSPVGELSVGSAGADSSPTHEVSLASKTTKG